jgi:integrase
MAKKNLMGWIAKRQTWQKRYQGRLYLVSCRQLGCEDTPTRAASLDLANAWWIAKRAEIDGQPPPPKNEYQRFVEWTKTQPPEEMDTSMKSLGYGMLINDRFRQYEKQQGGKRNNDTLASLIARYLDKKKAEAEAGIIGVNRWAAIERYLRQFREHVGNDIDPHKLNGVQLESFNTFLTKRIASKVIQPDTAKSIIVAVKSFYKWLWQIGIVETLPRNFDAVSIKVIPKQVKTLSIDFVKDILGRAKDRERLFILLMANCGFTACDISDLKQAEVDWTAGIITRKRSKTKGCVNVPVVRYTLWRETFALLRQFRNNKSENVLTDKNGNTLQKTRIENGKLKATCCIRSCLLAMYEREGIPQQPPKLFRKTSATLLFNSSFSQHAETLLGHAPSTIARRNYIDDGAGSNFSDALLWLGKQYGVE